MAERVRAAHLLAIAQVTSNNVTRKAILTAFDNASDAQRTAALAALTT